jgi:hypothetical protein
VAAAGYEGIDCALPAGELGGDSALNCDEDSSLDGAEIDDPQEDVQPKNLEEEFVQQDAEDKLIDESEELDNDEKKILANEEEVKQLVSNAEEVFSGEVGLEFPKSDVEMVDISSLQFAHIRGGSLVEVAELSRGEFCKVGDLGVEMDQVMELSRGELGQSDDLMPAKVTLRLTWTIAWEEVNKADMPSGKFEQVSDHGVEVRNKELPRANFTWNIAWTDEDNADRVVWVGLVVGDMGYLVMGYFVKKVCLDWDPGPDKLRIHDVGPGFGQFYDVVSAKKNDAKLRQKTFRKLFDKEHMMLIKTELPRVDCTTRSST